MTKTPNITVAAAPPDPDSARRLLASLPEWFGIDEANAHYVEAAETMPTWLAVPPAGSPVGLVLVRRHFSASAELYLMAVHPDWHRRGVGRALLVEVEAALARDGVRLLQVKTLGAARQDERYDRTRAFYLAVGFVPLEEFPDLWPGNPCLLLAKVLSPPDGTPG